MNKTLSHEEFSKIREQLLSNLSHAAAMAYTGRDARSFSCEAVAENYFAAMIEKIENAQELSCQALDALKELLPSDPVSPLKDAA